MMPAGTHLAPALSTGIEPQLVSAAELARVSQPVHYGRVGWLLQETTVWRESLKHLA